LVGSLKGYQYRNQEVVCGSSAFLGEGICSKGSA
jgi:hypothetical protein